MENEAQAIRQGVAQKVVFEMIVILRPLSIPLKLRVKYSRYKRFGCGYEQRGRTQNHQEAALLRYPLRQRLTFSGEMARPVVLGLGKAKPE